MTQSTRRISITVDGRNVVVHHHFGDLSPGVTFNGAIAVDTETMGLSLQRDRLCVVQLSDGGEEAHVVQLGPTINAPVLAGVLSNPAHEKLFHFARFDVAMVRRSMSVNIAPVYCTKIASKLARTYTDRHGLKDLVKELIGVELSKAQQSSDWGAAELSDAQLAYAASDVLHLHTLKARLDVMLAREGRTELAKACFEFLAHRATLDLNGWEEADIFAHS
jgi:ribonuclease D